MGLKPRHIVTVQRKVPDITSEHLREGGYHTRKKKRIRGGMGLGDTLTEEDPPGAEHGTCKDKNSPYDNDDNKRLSYRSIEGAEGGSSPIHPRCAGAIR